MGLSLGLPAAGGQKSTHVAFRKGSVREGVRVMLVNTCVSLQLFRVGLRLGFSLFGAMFVASRVGTHLPGA